MSLSFLEKRGYALAEPESSGSRFKVLALTPKGRRAQKLYGLGERWEERFGKHAIRALREPLERLVEPAGPSSPLFRGLEPFPARWRASVPPQELPHFPMFLHRGGFPDGS